MAAPDSDQPVADRIARAVRRGRDADRSPTVAQLLQAFGEPADTPEARARAARALALAGVAVRPELASAPAGSRVALEARAQRRRWWPWALAALLLATLIALAFASQQLIKTDGEEKVRTVVQAAPPAVTVPAATTETTTTPAGPSAAERRRARRAKAKRAAAARRRRARAPVTVRVTAVAPTFLCVEDGTGRRLFDGNLAGSRTFKARVVRLNVGLASTRVVANGKPVTLSGSPTGVQISRRRNTYLPLGARPCA